MSLKLPNDKVVYNLPEQVGVNAENIKYLAEVYKEIDSIPAQYADLKEDYDTNIKAYFDDTMKPTFSGWTTTFNGWTNTLDTYLANMSSAAVGAISGQTITPAVVNAGTSIYSPTITGDSIIENMSGYSFTAGSTSGVSINYSYVGAVKTGNKLTVVLAGEITRTDANANSFSFGDLYIPSAIGAKLYPFSLSPFNNIIASLGIRAWVDYGVGNTIIFTGLFQKYANNYMHIVGYSAALTLNTTYVFRIEQTFLLSDSLAS